MTRTSIGALIGFAWLAVLSPGVTGAADDKPLSGKLLVFAAASTTEAVEELCKEFARLHPGVTLRTSFGASSSLAQQIVAGARADLFLSASTQWAEFLRQRRLVERACNLLGNQLVVVTPIGSKIEFSAPADLAQGKLRRLALADPQSVPAGIYAKAALVKLGLWKQLEARVAGAANVRQALYFVESGAAEAGIVYATDARASKQVRVALAIDPALGDPIRYPLLLLEHGADRGAAVAFYEFLASEAAGAVFRRHGFVALRARERARSGTD